MAPAENVRTNRMRPRYRGVMKWVCMGMLLACCARFPCKSACSGRDGLRRRRPASTAAQARRSRAEDSAARDGVTEGPAHERPHGEDAILEMVYGRLLSLREAFVRLHADSWLYNPGTHFAEGRIRGMEIVAGLVPQALRIAEKQSGREGGFTENYFMTQYGIIEEGEVVELESAVTGTLGVYTFRRDGYSWFLLGPNGKRHRHEVWPLDEDRAMRRRRAYTAPESIEAIMALPGLFNVCSLAAVESELGVRVIRDMAVSPHERPDISFSRGSILNFINLWTPTDIGLSTFARTIETDRSLYEDSDAALAAAKYCISLQLIEIVGGITGRGVLLGRFDVSNFTIDSSGHIFFQIPDGIRTAEESHSSASGDATAASSSGDIGGWPINDPKTNAKDLCRVLVYLWCPSEAREISIYSSSPATDDVLRVAKQCNSLPRKIFHIVELIFESHLDTNQILSSGEYTELHASLRQLLEGDGSP